MAGRERFTEKLIFEWRPNVQASRDEVQERAFPVWDQQPKALRWACGWPVQQGQGWDGVRHVARAWGGGSQRAGGRRLRK